MEENFLLFVREEQGMPRLITALEERPANHAALPNLVIARLPYQAKDNGLPATNELDRLVKLEDRVIAELKRLGAVLLGHITFNGSYDVAFHSGPGIPSELSLKTGLLSKVKIPLQVRLDRDWSWFEHEMVPNPVEREFAMNQQLLGTLREHGDDHSIPRPVDFGVYFPSDASRAAFLLAVSEFEFTLSSAGAWENEGDFWCELVLETDIEPWTIAEHCAYLRDQAIRYGGSFDGWATPVRN